MKPYLAPISKDELIDWFKNNPVVWCTEYRLSDMEELRQYVIEHTPHGDMLETDIVKGADEIGRRKGGGFVRIESRKTNLVQVLETARYKYRLEHPGSLYLKVKAFNDGMALALGNQWAGDYGAELVKLTVAYDSGEIVRRQVLRTYPAKVNV